MKKIFRFVGLGGLLTAIVAVGAVASFAQDACADVDGQNALYQDQVLKFYKTEDPDVLQKAVDAGKQFLEKYGSCDSTKQITDWLKPKVPVWEANVPKMREEIKLKGLYTKFDTGAKAKNWDDVYSSGKEILTIKPDTLDAIIVMGSIGLDEAGKKNNKYNDDTITYAKLAIDKINSGVTSKTFGTLGYAYNTKENAIGWMNMTIGYLMFEPKNDRKGALPYLYKATTVGGPETRDYAVPYELIGRYFLGESITLTNELKAIVASQDPKDADDVKAKKEADYKAKKAVFNGYLERALDAYARAYKLAKPDNKVYKDAMYAKFKEIYNVRFQKDDGVDTYIASATAKPLVDPMSPVTPIEDVEVKPTTDTTKTGAATPTPTPATKPGETSGVTKAAVTAKEGMAKGSTETAKTPVVKKANR